MTGKIISAALSDIGPLKEINQDSFFHAIREDEDSCAAVFAVADGVSGSSHGEVASGICAAELKKWWENVFPQVKDDKSKTIQAMAEFIISVNQTVCETLLPNKGRSATTLTVLLLLGSEWIVFNVGDSRVYRLKSRLFSKLEQLTEDQTCLVEREYQGRKYLKSVLTSCIGGRNRLEYQYASGTLLDGDRFLICSDGVYKTQTTRQMGKILGKRGRSPEQLCQDFIRAALSNGENDNITAVTAIYTAGGEGRRD